MTNYREQHLAEDWTICMTTRRAIIQKCKYGTIVEFGSGIGTVRLADCFEVITFEHDPEWLIYPPNRVSPVLTENRIHQIHAPIVKSWYDRECVVVNLYIAEAESRKKKFSGVLIDGPPAKIGREGLLKNLDIFRRYFSKCPIFLDDTNREDDMRVAIDLARTLERNLSTFDCNDPAKPGVKYSIIEEAR